MVVAVSFLVKMENRQVQVVKGMNIFATAVLNGNGQSDILHPGEQKPLPA